MLDLLKRVTETDLLLRKGWSGAREDFIGRNLFKKTVGLIGLGNTGGRVAEICQNGFSCDILAYDPYISNERFSKLNAKKTNLDELLFESDIVSVHIPLTKETHNFIDKNFYSKMKKGSLFITTSRGSIHNEDDLETVVLQLYLQNETPTGVSTTGNRYYLIKSDGGFSGGITDWLGGQVVYQNPDGTANLSSNATVYAGLPMDPRI